MSFRVTILGSSGALPAYGRHPSAQLVEIQNRYFLVDCGEATQIQLMKFDASFHRINHIFISHLHGDHYLGLMGLIFTLHLQKRTADLHLYSHRGLDEIITTQFKYSHSAPSFKLIFHRLEKDEKKIIFEDDALTVETIPLKHKLRCSGFLFREKPKPRRIDKEKVPDGLLIQDMVALKRGDDILDEDGKVQYKNKDLTFDPRHSRSYAYCSDTAFDLTLTQQLAGIDLLYHEATFLDDDHHKAKETLHSTAKEAATIAEKAGVHKLLLGHFSARNKDLTPLLEEAKAIFGNSHLALEGQEFTIDE